jgi:hypothetical protein
VTKRVVLTILSVLLMALGALAAIGIGLLAGGYAMPSQVASEPAPGPDSAR